MFDLIDFTSLFEPDSPTYFYERRKGLPEAVWGILWEQQDTPAPNQRMQDMWESRS